MKKELMRYVFILITLFFVSVFIYPTPHKYIQFDQYTIKINRITNEAWLLEPFKGWAKISDIEE